jgi:hypothetical protein
LINAKIRSAGAFMTVERTTLKVSGFREATAKSDPIAATINAKT